MSLQPGWDQPVAGGPQDQLLSLQFKDGQRRRFGVRAQMLEPLRQARCRVAQSFFAARLFFVLCQARPWTTTSSPSVFAPAHG